MSVRRVMGTETEYGISVPGQPGANAMLTSSQVVNAYRRPPRPGRAGPAGTSRRSPRCATPAASTWPARRRTPASSPTRTSGLANVILTNGARLYVDHAHPEYSTPEVHQPARRRALGQGGRAGDGRGRAPRPRTVPGSAPIQLYKNNTDNKGASYGSHENYLMRRATPFADIVRHLTPFFVTRQVVCGAGPGRHRRRTAASDGFQISQRADFFEVEVGLETTLKRPIINTRDEPHADAGEVPPAARDHRRRQPVPRSRPTSRSARPRWCWR